MREDREGPDVENSRCARPHKCHPNLTFAKTIGLQFLIASQMPSTPPINVIPHDRCHPEAKPKDLQFQRSRVSNKSSLHNICNPDPEECEGEGSAVCLKAAPQAHPGRLGVEQLPPLPNRNGRTCRDRVRMDSHKARTEHRGAGTSIAIAFKPTEGLNGPRIIKGRPFSVSCGCCAEAVNQSHQRGTPR